MNASADPPTQPHESDSPGRQDPALKLTPPLIVAGVLIAIAILAPLLVPTYAKADPHLWGFPFFYWYQLLWIVIAVIVASIAYRLIIGEERKRRTAAGLSRTARPGAAADESPADVAVPAATRHHDADTDDSPSEPEEDDR